MPEHAHRARLLLSFMAALAIMGCSSLRGDPAGVAIGEGRQQACQRACSAIAPEDAAERCEPCNCDKLAGNPAICTTTRRRIP
ncbi:hypothetical protein BH11PSE13_BH11PSE13_18730 [soil metagenome]